jgi:hypothetical protein
MPLPSPKPDEIEEEWIARCMGSEPMQEEFPDNDQRLAVCYTKWRDAQEEKRIKKDSFRGISDI